ncbi:MAG: YbaB/EbfC family nucleoid-associated protein [Coriobacteriia bacterium]|nr:YbaB/EbfC family nucleoid-associated protein [Coriobacteriia bacterium]
MDMRKMMREAQKMQQEMEIAQEEIAQFTAEASAGGGMVKVVARGNITIDSISINPEAIDLEDISMLEDMIMAAANDAIRSVAELADQRMSVVTGGLNIPGF